MSVYILFKEFTNHILHNIRFALWSLWNSILSPPLCHHPLYLTSQLNPDPHSSIFLHDLTHCSCSGLDRFIQISSTSFCPLNALAVYSASFTSCWWIVFYGIVWWWCTRFFFLRGHSGCLETFQVTSEPFTWLAKNSWHILKHICVTGKFMPQATIFLVETKNWIRSLSHGFYITSYHR